MISGENCLQRKVILNLPSIPGPGQVLGFATIAAAIFVTPLLLYWFPKEILWLACLGISVAGIVQNEDLWDYNPETGSPF